MVISIKSYLANSIVGLGRTYFFNVWRLKSMVITRRMTPTAPPKLWSSEEGSLRHCFPPNSSSLEAGILMIRTGMLIGYTEIWYLFCLGITLNYPLIYWFASWKHHPLFKKGGYPPVFYHLNFIYFCQGGMVSSKIFNNQRVRFFRLAVYWLYQWCCLTG